MSMGTTATFFHVALSSLWTSKRHRREDRLKSAGDARWPRADKTHVFVGPEVRLVPRLNVNEEIVFHVLVLQGRIRVSMLKRRESSRREGMISENKTKLRTVTTGVGGGCACKKGIEIVILGPKRSTGKANRGNEGGNSPVLQ